MGQKANGPRGAGIENKMLGEQAASPSTPLTTDFDVAKKADNSAQKGLLGVLCLDGRAKAGHSLIEGHRLGGVGREGRCKARR